MWRVYISSTYKDLVEPRRAVRDAVLGLGHHPVGMEDYAASDERPKDKCLADIESCDAYVCIVAWRYGYCPDGGERSITYLEYERAGAVGIPRFVFLLDENANWPRTLIPDSEQTAVKVFKNGSLGVLLLPLATIIFMLSRINLRIAEISRSCLSKKYVHPGAG